jgi:hypothetical protein
MANKKKHAKQIQESRAAFESESINQLNVMPCLFWHLAAINMYRQLVA